MSEFASLRAGRRRRQVTGRDKYQHQLIGRIIFNVIVKKTLPVIRTYDNFTSQL
jgi:hypothetical protein